jgi:hypothetical protein
MTKAQKDFVGAVGIAAMMLLVFGLVAYLGFSKARSIDDKSLCDSGYFNRTNRIIIVDKTDPLPALALGNLRQAVLEQRDKLKVQDRIWIFAMSGAGIDVSVPLFSECRPESGADVSGFSRNPEKVEHAYKNRFEAPLNAALATLLLPGTADASPIMETLGRASASRAFDGVEPRHIVLVTDLLQNSPMFSAYGASWGRRPDAESIGKLMVLDYGRVFSSMELTILVIDRHLKNVPSQTDLREYWKDALAAAGISVLTIRAL